MSRAGAWRPWSAVLVGLLLLAAQAGIGPPAARAAGPLIVLTDPAPGSTVLVGAGFRIGWTESASPRAPIVARTVAAYVAPKPADGYCANRTYALGWTDTRANRPFSFPVVRLAPLACYYVVVTVTDVNGTSTSARSGYLLGLPARDPAASVTSPAPGAVTTAPPSTFELTWRESASAGVTRRFVTEQSAPMGPDRSCPATGWSSGRTFQPAAPSLEVEGLAEGTCYRYVVAIWDTSGGSASATSGPLLVSSIPPQCVYGDVPTSDGTLDDWARTLLDPTYRLAPRYSPLDLVSTRTLTGVNPSQRVRRVVLADLQAMVDAARAAGAPIDLTSAFRSYVGQQATYEYYAKALGPAGGLLRAARPGHSEHQLGTTIDVMGYDGVSPSNFTDWTVTKAGAWMRDNAWRFGWLMSYPKASSPAMTCYQYEPWHYRYVGRAVAAAVHASGLSLREYLWRHGSITPGA